MSGPDTSAVIDYLVGEGAAPAALPAPEERPSPVAEVLCPEGHKLTFPREVIASGREVFCPQCRKAFSPELPAPASAADAAPEAIEEDRPEREGSLLDALQVQFGTTPWWVVSAVVHACLLLMTTLLGIAIARPVEDVVTLESPPPGPEVDKYNERVKRDVFRNVHAPMREKLDEPKVFRDPIRDQRFETENQRDLRKALGREDAISDIPLGGIGAVASLGVGGGPSAGAYGFRDGGGRKRAVKHFGGSQGSESAVEAALRWLARHQESDGRWDAKKWEGSQRTDAGITGLALLAFVGAGYTQKAGRHKKTVYRAMNWIVSKQNAKGAIGMGYEGTEPQGVGYHHSICGLALAEAYGMTRDKAFKAAAQKAADYSVNLHGSPYSGWRYTPKQDADLSVTGWFVMQLKSARLAGLKVPQKAFMGARQFTDKVGDARGRCRYKPDWLSPSSTMTSVGMLVWLYTGSRPEDRKVSGGADYLLRSLPDWGEHGTNVNMYYWYYGTMTMFQVGGKRWKKWNGALRDMLCDNQRTGGPRDGGAKDVDGSWDPIGAWARRGGRVYSTAIGALTLEVYYRYLRIYEK